MISAIIACDRKGGIAKNGTMPWPKTPEDLQLFKDFTMNRTVIMGSKTWHDPIFPKPLPNRHTVVLTTKILEGPDELVSGDPEDILNARNDSPIVIGGADTFNQFYNFIDELRISIFKDDFDCDTFIPLTKITQDFEVIDGKTFKTFDHYIVRKMKNV